MYFRVEPSKTEVLVFNEIQSIVAPLKIRRYDQVLYEPYRTKILDAITSRKTKIKPESIVKIMAEVYKDYIRSYENNLNLHAAGYFIKKTLEDTSPRELLPIWDYYANGTGENK